MKINLKLEFAAEVAHEVNRVFCKSMGDNSQLHWENAPEWQRDSAMAGVNAIIQSGYKMRPEDSHNSWMKHKLKDGWKYGSEKDAEKKEHPCLLPYCALPCDQKAKDAIFIKIIRIFTGYEGVND